MDSKFRIEVVSQTANPQSTCWIAMHQDYTEGFSLDNLGLISESSAGLSVFKNCLSSDRGHYGVLEHPQLCVNVGGFPHSTMQQLRTHRHLSFDVQSFRYTGQNIIDAAKGDKDVEDVFYLRPVGFYTDRKGKKYEYKEDMRAFDKTILFKSAERYAYQIEEGYAEEHARGLIPFDIRQNFVMSGNARSMLHLLDLRSKLDAQLECREFSELLFNVFKQWMPEVADWYEQKRYTRARLAP